MMRSSVLRSSPRSLRLSLSRIRLLRVDNGFSCSPLQLGFPRWLAIRATDTVDGPRLLDELRAFAQLPPNPSADLRRMRRALASVESPKDMAPDVDALLLGEKRLLTADDGVEFSCTGCGGCCRGFSDTVLVDAADLFAMEFSGGGARLPSLEPASFRLRTGYFHVAALPRGEQAVSLAAQAYIPAHLQQARQHAVSLEAFELGGDGGRESASPAAAVVADDAACSSHDTALAAPPAEPAACLQQRDGFGAAVTGPRYAALAAAGETDVATGAPLLQGGLAPILYLRSRAVAAEADGSERAGAGAGFHSASAGNPPSDVSSSVGDSAASTSQQRGGRRRRGASGGAAAMTSSAPSTVRGRDSNNSDSGLRLFPDPVIAIAGDGHRVCPFAVPGPRLPPPLLGRSDTTAPSVSPQRAGVGAASADAPASAAESGAMGAAPASSLRRPEVTAGLRCSLGPHGMPYTCALYPLGDFWARAVEAAGASTLPPAGSCAQPASATNASAALEGSRSLESSRVLAQAGPQQQQAGPEQQQQLFFTLDHVRCEGVGVAGHGVARGDAGGVGGGDAPAPASPSPAQGGAPAAAHPPRNLLTPSAAAAALAEPHLLQQPCSAPIPVPAPPHACSGSNSSGSTGSASSGSSGSIASGVGTVQRYRTAPHRRLDVRRQRAEWFRVLATTVAALQLDQRLAAAVETAEAAATQLAAVEALLLQLHSQSPSSHEGSSGPADALGPSLLEAEVAAVGQRAPRTAAAADPLPLLPELIAGANQRVRMGAAAEGALHTATATGAALDSGVVADVNADTAAAFVSALLAQAWYFHPHGRSVLSPPDDSTAAAAAAAAADSDLSAGLQQRGASDEARPVRAHAKAASRSLPWSTAGHERYRAGEEEEAWRRWRASVEDCTAAAVAHAHACITALQHRAGTWEAEAARLNAIVLQKRQDQCGGERSGLHPSAGAALPAAGEVSDAAPAAERRSRRRGSSKGSYTQPVAVAQWMAQSSLPASWGGPAASVKQPTSAGNATPAAAGRPGLSREAQLQAAARGLQLARSLTAQLLHGRT